MQWFGRGNGNQYAQSRQKSGYAYIAQSKENSQLEISAFNDLDVGRLNREEIERLHAFWLQWVSLLLHALSPN